MPEPGQNSVLDPLTGLASTACRLREGEVRSVDLLSEQLNRLDRLDGVLNAVLWQQRDAAYAAAEAADRRRAAGGVLPVLHGVPLAHKDLFGIAGWQQTAGSDFWRDGHRAATTSTVLERLASAGSYAFAGLHMADFAQNPTGQNATFGDCINPWNADAITGGSSSGSGVAVAVGYTLAALGTDTGGSIRLPAACCGVTGLKPSWGRVSRAGVVPLCASLDVVGPLARTAADCALILGLIAGADPADPTCSDLPVPDYTAALDGDLRGQRIGVPTDWFVDGNAGVWATCRTALDVLRGRGASVVELSLPLAAEIVTYGGVVARVEASALHAEWMRAAPERYAPHVSARLYQGYAIPATFYVEAISRRPAILAAFVAAVFARVDVLLLPTLPGMAPTRTDTDIDHGPPGTERRFFQVGDNARPFNYLGLPAISFPVGFDAAGVPIGAQLVGRPFGEARLLRLVDAYQRDTGVPPMPPMAVA